MSNAIVDAELVTHLAEVTRVVPTPVAPFGYGTDVSTRDDMAEDAADVDGMSPEALAEALHRRLSTPRGGLIDDPSYGYDLRQELNRPVVLPRFYAESAGRVHSEITKDDRVAFASVECKALAADGSSLRYTLRVTPVDPRTGGFELTLAVTSSTVLLEAVARAA